MKKLTTKQTQQRIKQAVAQLGWAIAFNQDGTLTVMNGGGVKEYRDAHYAWTFAVSPALTQFKRAKSRNGPTPERLELNDPNVIRVLVSDADAVAVAKALGKSPRTINRYRKAMKDGTYEGFMMPPRPLIKHPDAGPPARVSTPQRNGIAIGQHLFRKSDGREFVVDAFPVESDMVSLRCVATRAPWSIRRGDVPVLLNGSKGVAA